MRASSFISRAFLSAAVLMLSCSADGDSQEPGEEFSAERIIESRKEKDQAFGTVDSPIPAEKRMSFKGLNYFEPNEEFALPAVLTPFPKADTVQMLTSKAGDVRKMLRYGKFSFFIAEREYSLTAFRHIGAHEELFFIPFKDATSGRESYGAGRYIDLEESGSDEYILDFNQAYNPYCAYNENYSCPLVPEENILAVAIKAGEKNYSK